jgi:hypothetical protein
MPAHAWISRINVDRRGSRSETDITITDDTSGGYDVVGMKFSDLPAGHQHALKQFIEKG